MKKTLLYILLAAGCTNPVAPPAGNDAGAIVPPADAAIPSDDASAPAGDVWAAGELLGRPTASSVSLNLVPAKSVEMYVEYGPAAGAYDHQTPPALYPANQPFSIVMNGLAPDAAYAYRIRYRIPGDPAFQSGVRHTFHTQRPSGASFRFTVQADSHLDENSNLEQYRRTLGNVLDDGPDFHIDLGDTFMCEKHSKPFDAVMMPAPDAPTVDARYLYERAHFGMIAHSVPLFLVNGNHEGELGFLIKGTGMDLPTWVTKARQRFYLNPTPDSFYSGDVTNEPVVGQRAAYYAWQWGDALFVALDPFWYTTKRSNSDGWVWTLGAKQFQWLEQTLKGSTAKWKFVFLHNLVGGLDGQMRGGVEAAPYFEWGGKNMDGTAGFAQQRNGWSKPIHQLLVENKVTAVFHGHDHLYAKQDLDGIVYQEVPQPSAKNTQSGAMLAADYHYAAGKILSSAGHLRVTVAPDQVTGEYVRAWLPAAENGMRKNGQIDDTWTVK